MRELFLSRLIELLDKNSINWEIFSKVRYDHFINEVNKTKEKSHKEPADHSFLLKYNIVVENDIQKLVKPVDSNHHKYYVYEEELYDIIYNAHISLDHASVPQVFKVLQSKYINIPLQIIHLCLSLCQACSSQKSVIKELNTPNDNPQSISVDQQSNCSSRSESSLNSLVRIAEPSENDNILVIDISDDDDDVNKNYSDISHNNVSNGIIDKDVKNIIVSERLNPIKEDCGNLLMPSNNVTLPPQDLSSSHQFFISDEPGLSHQSNLDKSLDSVTDVQDELPQSFEAETKEDEMDEESPTDVCLHWNLYDSNMKSVLTDFLNEERFVDVTLTCENESIKCHKVILSSSSRYFEKFFTQNPYGHPTLFMEGFSFWKVQALIEFIYKGEVKIPRHKLESLLDAAEALQIKGLADPVEKKAKGKIRKNMSKKKLRVKNFNVQEKKHNIVSVVKNTLPFREQGGIIKIDNQITSEYGVDVMNVASASSNDVSQNSEPRPNMYTVFTPTYITTASPINSQNFVPINHSSTSFPSPQLSYAQVAGSQLCQSGIPSSHVTCNSVSSSLSAHNSAVQMQYRNPSIQGSGFSFTVSRSSCTQTSPTREGEDNNSDDDIRVINSHVKKEKVQNLNQEFNAVYFQEMEGKSGKKICNKNKKVMKGRKQVKRKKCSKNINDKINSLMVSGNTNVIFTRKKTADMQSVAKRTRKKQSEIMRKKGRLLKDLI